MKNYLFASVLFISAIAQAADTNFIGKVFAGIDSRTQSKCEIKISDIKKSILVDKVTIEVTIEGSEPYTITMGEYNLQKRSYSRFIDTQYFEFNFGSENSPAHFTRSQYIRDGLVDSPAFSSSRVISKCENLN